MPSRIMHEFLVHLIESSDVDIPHPDPIEIRSTSGFQALYMGHFQPQITLRRHLRGSEMDNLPVELYREFISLLEHLARSGEAIDVSRRFRGVRLINMDTMINPESFTPDFRLEFTCESLDMEQEETVRQRTERERRRAEMDERMRTMLQQPRRSAMLPPDWFDDEKPKKVVRKNEEHFDKDLFEV